MKKRLAGETILIIFFFLFSWWLMSKSFGYDEAGSQFRVARHEVGDFGLHLSLIRSFAWGNNDPSQSPFFSGAPLRYHDGIDWAAGQLVRRGIRIDNALNGISALALTILLFGMYRLGGILSIVLFLLPANLSFLELLKNAPKDLSFFSYVWRFPDYIHKGPFDGSFITIYTTLSPYLNQRHLIAGMAMAVWVIWFLLGRQGASLWPWVAIGVTLGVMTRVHALVALATSLMVVFLLFRKNNKAIVIIGVTAILIASPFLRAIGSSPGMFAWNPGYLAQRPLSFISWLSFWIQNLGTLVFLIPVALWQANALGKRLMMGAGALFVAANLVQVSYRIEHNHSLINYATVLVLPFVACLLTTWFTRDIRWKLLAGATLFLLTISGVFNLMVVKNDYQATIDDAPKNGFIHWVRTQTDPASIFISTHALYDPVTLAGRKNYLGQEYYVTVMGYDYWGRRKQITRWLGNINQDVIREVKVQGIDYLVIPKERNEFPYAVNESRVRELLPMIYEDTSYTVYEF